MGKWNSLSLFCLIYRIKVWNKCLASLFRLSIAFLKGDYVLVGLASSEFVTGIG